ncbi:hypothetical protein [Ascidiaceihabitans sp.]|uniref:hypothetical protein n=1 Tax=Ascidiaceihabitans sp. TaxID=1872644 RepID=UPI0032997BBF
MTQNKSEMMDLDALLAGAKNPPAPEALMARVLEDALKEQPLPTLRETPTMMQQILAVLGGWQGMGGLVAATCAGLWIGISPPTNLPDGLISLLGSDTGTAAVFTQQEPELGSFGWDLEES